MHTYLRADFRKDLNLDRLSLLLETLIFGLLVLGQGHRLGVLLRLFLYELQLLHPVSLHLLCESFLAVHVHELELGLIVREAIIFASAGTTCGENGQCVSVLRLCEQW